MPFTSNRKILFEVLEKDILKNQMILLKKNKTHLWFAILKEFQTGLIFSLLIL